MRRVKHNKNQIISKYIRNNIKEILTISMIFIIGIICGVILINNIKNERKIGN